MSRQRQGDIREAEQADAVVVGSSDGTELATMIGPWQSRHGLDVSTNGNEQHENKKIGHHHEHPASRGAEYIRAMGARKVQR